MPSPSHGSRGVTSVERDCDIRVTSRASGQTPHDMFDTMAKSVENRGSYKLLQAVLYSHLRTCIEDETWK